MNKFETMLLDKGYIKHILNGRTMKFEKTDKHIISTMVNLSHIYIPPTNKKQLQFIAEGKSVMDEDYSWSIRKGEIWFGLHEKDKPPTLISPRPRIEVKRIRNGIEVVETEDFDDSMNIVLNTIPHEEIYEALFNPNIVFKIDLTENKI